MNITNEGSNDNNIGDGFLNGDVSLKSHCVILVNKSHTLSISITKRNLKGRPMPRGLLRAHSGLHSKENFCLVHNTIKYIILYVTDVVMMILAYKNC